MTSATATAWIVDKPGPIGGGPLRLIEREIPVPGPGQIRVAVSCCGVCRTDLHLAEGDLPPRRHGVTPGHEVVGRVDALGDGADRFAAGSGSACRGSAGPTAPADSAAGAARTSVWRRPSPDGTSTAATPTPAWSTRRMRTRCPRARRRARRAAAVRRHHRLPRRCGPRPCPAGGALGIYGFGGSAHLTAQIALHDGAAGARPDAAGTTTANSPRRSASTPWPAAEDSPPERLDGAILFAPAGDLVPVALRALDRGATLAVAGIWLSDIPRAELRAASCSRSGGCAASPRTRARTGAVPRLAHRFAIRATTTAYPMATRRGRSRTSPPAPSAAPPSSTTPDHPPDSDPQRSVIRAESRPLRGQSGRSGAGVRRW